MTSILPSTQAFGERRVRGEPRLHTDGELLLLGHAADGSLLSIEEPGTLRRWDGATGHPLDWHALSDVETLWGLSRDGRILASASDDLTLWDTTSGLVLTALTQPSWVTALTFAPDSSLIATGHDDGSVRLWDGPNHRLRFEHVPSEGCPISALALSGEGRLLAAAVEDRRIRVWDLDERRHIGTLEGHTDRIAALAWHPDGRLLSAGWDGSVRVWDTRLLATIFVFNTHEGQVTALAVSPDGRRLASADARPAVRVWDIERGRLLHLLAVPGAEVRAVSFSPTGARVACCGDRSIHVWDAETGQPLIGAGRPSSTRPTFAVSPDGRRVVTNGGGSSVQVWDVDLLEPVRTLESPDVVHQVAFSPDGQRIAGAARDRVRIWDAQNGALLADWDGPLEPITTLAFSDDGTLLATGSAEGYDVWIWRVADGEPVLLIPDALDGCAIETLAFKPGKHTIAVGGVDWLATGGSNGAVSLWDVPGRFECELVPEGTTALAFAPDGGRLAFATLEGGVAIWGVAERELVAEVARHEGIVTCLAFSCDGRLLATGGDDNTVRLWNQAGEEIGFIELESRPTALAFGPEGEYLHVAHANTTWSRLDLRVVGPGSPSP